MGQPIPVMRKEPWNTMDPQSRVSFLKLYTVEHNIKVDDFGRAHINDECTRLNPDLTMRLGGTFLHNFAFPPYSNTGNTA
jgi:hypothetical protein